jgi:predicted exporter
MFLRFSVLQRLFFVLITCCATYYSYRAVVSGEGIETDIVALLLKDDIIDEGEAALSHVIGTATRKKILLQVKGKRRQEAFRAFLAEGQKVGITLPNLDDPLKQLKTLLVEHQFMLPSLTWTGIMKSLKPEVEFKKYFERELSGIGGGTTLDLSSDPFLLQHAFMQEKVAPLLQETAFSEQKLYDTSSNEIVQTLKINDTTPVLMTPEKFTNSINALIFSIEKRFAVKIEWSGYIRFAADSARRLQSEIQLFSTIAFIGSVGTSLLIFRSLRQILLSSLLVAVGYLWGLGATLFFEGGVHLVTIGFGAGLMGVSVDYSIHYFCEQLVSPKQATGADILTRVQRPITFGMITSSIVFIMLAFFSFPGLRELAIFSCFGLLGAYLTVVVLFPYCAGSGLGQSKSWIIRKVDACFSWWLFQLQRSVDIKAKNFRSILVLISLGLLTYGVTLLENDDNIRRLQGVNAGLQKTHEKLLNRSAESLDNSTSLFLFAASNEDQLLLKSRKLQKVLQQLKEEKLITAFINPLSIWPSVEEQKTHFDNLFYFLQKRSSEFSKVLQSLGYERVTFEKERFVFQPLELKESTLFAKGGEALAVQTSLGIQGVVPLFGVENLNIVKQKLDNIGTFYSQADMISSLLTKYRRVSIKVALGAYLVVLLFLVTQYGLARGFLVLLPSILTTFCILAVIGLSGMPINFFHIIALIIVVGLSVDYNIFFYEHRDHWGAIGLTVLLSTLSTVLSFGLLAFSNTYLLQSIGLTTSVGVLLSTLFAPLACLVTMQLEELK